MVSKFSLTVLPIGQIIEQDAFRINPGFLERQRGQCTQYLKYHYLMNILWGKTLFNLKTHKLLI